VKFKSETRWAIVVLIAAVLTGVSFFLVDTRGLISWFDQYKPFIFGVLIVGGIALAGGGRRR
jgi:hypothetical protein